SRDWSSDVCSSDLVEDIGRGFQPFVLHRVPQQRVVALEHRQHCLAAGRGPATEDGHHLVLRDELLRLLGERVPVGGTVLDDRLDLLAQYAAGGVDLVDREQRGVPYRDLADRHGAAQGVQDPYRDDVAVIGGRTVRAAGDGERRDDRDRGQAPGETSWHTTSLPGGGWRVPDRPTGAGRRADRRNGSLPSTRPVDVVRVK